MTTTSTIISQIQTLRTEAGQAGDSAMVAMCDRAIAGDVELYDSDTAERLDVSELGCTTAEYVETICESLDCGQPEGNVRINGRLVYAQ
jgi:hypothetical protein